VENRGIRVNMNTTKVMICGEWQKVMQKAVRWPCGICGRGIGNNWRYVALVIVLWCLTLSALLSSAAAVASVTAVR